MKGPSIGSLAALLLAIVLVNASPAGAAAACTTATAACMEWISSQPGPGRSLVYATYPLTAKNAQITRALILVHGGNRDADNYFRTAVSAALLSGALDDTLIVSPRFAANNGNCRDALASDEINWDCGEITGGWRVGVAATNNAQMTSYDVMDMIVMKLAERANFPSVRSITVAGFSAGGQYVTRYEAVNQLHEKIGVPITYVVGSPSSYLYLDPQRPQPTGASVGTFADARNCTSYDQWPYGLARRTGYAAKLTNEQIQRQLVSRPVTYVVGELETPDSPALDLSCPATAQGSSRLTRAQGYLTYITEEYGARHRLLVVPQCGHSPRCVLTADSVLPFLFPKSP